MPVVENIIARDGNGISFGNYKLDVKAKANEFVFNGDNYEIKTFKDITKLERNSMFVFESVPGCSVFEFQTDSLKTSFKACGYEETQITLGLDENVEYEVFINGVSIGNDKTNISGKLVVSADLSDEPVDILIKRIF